VQVCLFCPKGLSLSLLLTSRHSARDSRIPAPRQRIRCAPRQQKPCATTAEALHHGASCQHADARSSLNSSWRLLLAGAAAAAAGTSFQIDMVQRCSLSWCSCSCSWRSSGAAWRLVATLAKLPSVEPLIGNLDGAPRFGLLRQSLLQGEHIGALLLRDGAFHFGPPLRRWLRNVRAARRLALLR
jgi:hypothetical protein